MSAGAAPPFSCEIAYSRQPGGFEGFALVKEPAQAGCPAVPQLDDPRPLVINLDAAQPPATSHVAEDQNAVAQVAEVSGLEPEGFPALGQVAEELTDAACARTAACKTRPTPLLSRPF